VVGRGTGDPQAEPRPAGPAPGGRAAAGPLDAGYPAWIDLRELGLGDDPATALLERTGVALTHGPPGRGHARLNFATSEAILREAVTRLARE